MRRTRSHILLLLTGIFSGSGLFSLYAARPASRLDSIQHIKEVVVTGKPTVNEIIPSQKLEGKALEKLNSFSVADALRYFSGIQIKDYGGIGGLKTVNIRSMGTNHMGVFYDGIQLGNAQNGQIDLGKFSLDNMEEISLYNGQKSEIFQPAKDYGSSGSIYLKTRKPRFNKDEKYHIRAAFKTGSFGLVNPSVLWEQKISRNVSSSLNAEFINANGRYKFRYKRKQLNGDVAYDTTATRHNGDVCAFRAEGGFNGIMNRGNWNVKAYFYDSERGIPGAIVNNVFRHGERQWDRNFFAQGSFQYDICSFYKLQINTKFADDFTHYLRDDEKELYVNNKYWQQEYYLSVANLFNLFSWWDVSVSADYQWNKLDANLKDFAYPKRHTGLVAVATAFQWEHFKMQASVLGTFIHENVIKKKESAASPDKQEFTPAVFASYKPFKSKNLYLRAFYKKIFRMPTFNDLYYTDIGNKYLKPEFTEQYNVGTVYNKMFNHNFFKYFNIQADGYYNKVTNKIIAYPTGQQFRWTMLNLGEVRIIGVDVAAQLSCQLNNVGIHARLNYTWQKAQDYTDPTDYYYKHQIPYIPWHSGSAIVSLEYGKWNLNYSFIYTGERYRQQMNSVDNYEQPWYTSDLALSRDIPVYKVNMNVTAEVNNIFNQYYDVVANFPMPGINYKLILRITI